MFDFLFRNKKGEIESLVNLISINVTKASISDSAINKAIGMIAKAIAKSEFVVSRKDKNVKDNVYWMLNVQANANENATEFWIKAITKLLTYGECLIICINQKLYIANSWQTNNAVAVEKEYSNLVVESKDDTLPLQGVFKSSDVIHLINPNKKIQFFLEKNLGLYNEIITGLIASKKISSVPKFTLDIEGSVPIIRKKNEDGTVKEITTDKYRKEIKKLLQSQEVEVLLNQNGLKINHLPTGQDMPSDEISKMSKEIFIECAYAFDIPRAVFLGEITEKADSTNEFITYAVGWLVEMLNDAMNMTLVGKEAYLKGERIWIDMTRYKHVDILESATNLDKLRSLGFTLDEIFEMLGRQPIRTNFSTKRVLTKNYSDEGDSNAKTKTSTI